MRVAGINLDCLHGKPGLTVDDNRRQQVGGRRSVLGESDDGETKHLRAYDGLVILGESQALEVFGSNGRFVVLTDRRHRQRDETDPRLAKALKKNDRLVNGLLDEKKTPFLREAWQALGKMNYCALVVGKLAEILALIFGHIVDDDHALPEPIAARYCSIFVA